MSVVVTRAEAPDGPSWFCRRLKRLSLPVLESNDAVTWGLGCGAALAVPTNCIAAAGAAASAPLCNSPWMRYSRPKSTAMTKSPRKTTVNNRRKTVPPPGGEPRRHKDEVAWRIRDDGCWERAVPTSDV